MNIAATTDPVVATRVDAAQAHLWPWLSTAWTRHLQRRIEQDLCRLDHAGVLADFRRAAGG